MLANVQCIKPQRKSSELSYRIKNPHRSNSSKFEKVIRRSNSRRYIFKDKSLLSGKNFKAIMDLIYPFFTVLSWCVFRKIWPIYYLCEISSRSNMPCRSFGIGGALSLNSKNTGGKNCIWYFAYIFKLIILCVSGAAGEGDSEDVKMWRCEDVSGCV